MAKRFAPPRPRFWLRLLVAALTFPLFWALGQPIESPPQAQAAPAERPSFVTAPAVSLDVPASVFIGETFTFTVTFDNTDTAPGYGPIIDLVLPTNGADGAPDPDGIAFVSAALFGYYGGSHRAYRALLTLCHPSLHRGRHRLGHSSLWTNSRGYLRGSTPALRLVHPGPAPSHRAGHGDDERPG